MRQSPVRRQLISQQRCPCDRDRSAGYRSPRQLGEVLLGFVYANSAHGDIVKNPTGQFKSVDLDSSAPTVTKGRVTTPASPCKRLEYVLHEKHQVEVVRRQ